jgi:ParB family chromosome partitioning protein
MLANVSQVPAIIRTGDTSMMKLELAIIENLQREDLNVVDRARAFYRLANEFKFTHNEIAKKMGKSREYVTNSLRILSLPEEILNALSEGKLTDGHTRPLLMLADHPEEQLVLFKEIVYKKISQNEIKYKKYYETKKQYTKYKNEFKYIPWLHYEKLPKFNKDDVLYFCDISPKKSRYLKFSYSVSGSCC